MKFTGISGHEMEFPEDSIAGYDDLDDVSIHAGERGKGVDIDFMASVLGVSATTAAFANHKPLTMEEIYEAISALESIPRPKDLTAAQLQSLLRQVLIECLLLKQENQKLRESSTTGAKQ